MRCKGCGWEVGSDNVCWLCPPVPKLPIPPKPVCSHEENMKRLAALRAAIYAKPGPMARIVAGVCRRMNGEEEAF